MTVTEYSLATIRDDPAAVEIVDDVAHYANLELSYLWAFTVWRLQAVFEGIIRESFLPEDTSPKSGFTRMLTALAGAGFTLDPADREELLKWADFRNALSHRPAYYYHAVRITEEDAQEYATLLQRILNRWKGCGDLLPYAPGVAEA